MTVQKNIIFLFGMAMFASLFFSSNLYAGQGSIKGKHKIYHMPPYEIGKYIKNSKGQKRIIMIYASWCPTCIQKMPKIMDIERVKSGSVVAISIDENYINFSRYIKRFKYIPFKVILNNGSEYKLAQSLSPYGIKAWDGIPYIILMDENNQVKGQGNYSVDRVAEFLFE